MVKKLRWRMTKGQIDGSSYAVFVPGIWDLRLELHVSRTAAER